MIGAALGWVLCSMFLAVVVYGAFNFRRIIRSLRRRGGR